ncbi:sensor histidine kinase [Muricoccus radiodurans]|uniref:sensor histidine kinase n=1 Tax=Muricoccus radiodurans TaxID=2231721 RepID=UPI003CE86B91
MADDRERPRSLLSQLALAHAVVAVMALIVGGVVLHQTLNRVVWVEHQRGILAAGSELTERLTREGIAGLSRPFTPENARRFNTATGSMLYAVVDAGGRAISVSPGADRALPVQGPDGAIPDSFQEGQDGGQLWGITRRIATPDGPLFVQIAQDMERAYIVLDDVPRSALGPVLAVLAVGALLLFLANVGLLLLMLRPVRRAARQAEAVGHGDRARLEVGTVPVELLPLIEAVNGALDRLDEALEWQRGFSAEVAHELRTPLAMILAELDLLEGDAVRDRLRQDVQELAQMVTDLLEAAEAARDQPVTGGRFDLAELVGETARRFMPIAEREGRTVRAPSPGPAIWVRGEREAIGRALRNLVENALNHTPDGTAVELRLAPGPLGAVVEVADQGRGVPEPERRTVFRRHWRAGDSRRRGLGLGLSIVERIVRAHGGTVEVRDNPGGGAVFALRLPAAAP